MSRCEPSHGRDVASWISLTDEAFLLRDESEDVLDTYRACNVRVCASTFM
jgi:hypothetical protein